MSGPFTLSIILTVHNQQDDIEETLTQIYGIDNLHTEVIIIDDASTDNSPDIIRSVIEYQDHNDTFFFQHESPAGRGVSLNEAMGQVTGEIIWAPTRITALDQDGLKDVCGHLLDEDQPMAIAYELALPGNSEAWVDYAVQTNWPVNDLFLFNFSAVPASERYLNPRMTRFQCMELALRLSRRGGAQSTNPFFKRGIGPEDEMLERQDSFNRQEFLFALYQIEENRAIRNEILEALQADQGKAVDLGADSDTEVLLKEVEARFISGDVAHAFDMVKQVLAAEPENRRALELKIAILEKLRRYVEASELKHQLKHDSEPSQGLSAGNEQPEGAVEEGTAHMDDKASEPSEQGADEATETTEKIGEDLDGEPQELANESGLEEPSFDITIIIPTTIDGKPFLEQSLVSVSQHCDPDHTHLLIVDNASLDDTYDYVNQLVESGFYNCRVIRNSTNAGFARSINQAREKVETPYVVVMHNDVLLSSDISQHLAAILASDEEIGLVSASADQTLNPAQQINYQEEVSTQLLEVDYLDSYLLAFRSDLDATFDESFGPAYFDDLDFSYQVKNSGKKLVVATDHQVQHLYGVTTLQLGLDMDSEIYWKNAAAFSQKWDLPPELPFQEDDSDIIKLCQLSEAMNPYHPEPSLIKIVEELLTDRLVTQIRESDLDDHVLFSLANLMMMIEERALLRQLEDRIESHGLPYSLIIKFLKFYYNRNIYSRCKHYLNRLSEDQQTIDTELIRLKVAIGERNMEDAVPLLNRLMEAFPSHIELIKLAGDIHAFNGNEKEAERFYEYAEQAAPFRYSNDQNISAIE